MKCFQLLCLISFVYSLLNMAFADSTVLWSKVCTVLDRTNTGIVDSKPAQGKAV